MPVPKRKLSRARIRKRQANKGIKAKIFTACAHCQEPLVPHSACMTCGFYKGRKIFATKLDRSITRREHSQERAQRAQEKAEQSQES